MDLEQLRREENVVTKLSRCDYFRHNSSRLGGLDESVEETQRPALGFVHNIRSPERQPCALLAETSPAGEGMSETFSLESPAQEEEEERSEWSDSTDMLKASDLASRLQILAGQSQSAATPYQDMVEDSI